MKILKNNKIKFLFIFIAILLGVAVLGGVVVINSISNQPKLLEIDEVTNLGKYDKDSKSLKPYQIQNSEFDISSSQISSRTSSWNIDLEKEFGDKVYIRDEFLSFYEIEDNIVISYSNFYYYYLLILENKTGEIVKSVVYSDGAKNLTKCDFLIDTSIFVNCEYGIDSISVERIDKDNFDNIWRFDEDLEYTGKLYNSESYFNLLVNSEKVFSFHKSNIFVLDKQSGELVYKYDTEENQHILPLGYYSNLDLFNEKIFIQSDLQSFKVYEYENFEFKEIYYTNSLTDGNNNMILLDKVVYKDGKYIGYYYDFYSKLSDNKYITGDEKEVIFKVHE